MNELNKLKITAKMIIPIIMYNITAMFIIILPFSFSICLGFSQEKFANNEPAKNPIDVDPKIFKIINNKICNTIYTEIWLYT